MATSETERQVVADAPPSKQSLTAKEVAQVIRGAAPVSMTLVGILALLYTMYFAADFFLPVLLAVFLSIIMRPVVRSLRVVGLPEKLGALCVILGLIATGAAALYYLSGPAQEWIERAPIIQSDLEAKLWPVQKSLQQAHEATEEFKKLASGRSPAYVTREVTLRGTSFVNQFFLSTWLTFAQIVITLVLTYFLLATDESQLRRGIRAISFLGPRKSLESAFEDIQITIPRFLQISTIIYACLGAMTALAMYLLGMPNPALWGIMAMILGFMPYLGPLVVFACIGTVALVSFESWWQIVAPPLAYGVMSTIEGTVITPMVLGRHLTLSPIAIFLSMILWTMILGVFGALLAVPILLILTILGQHLATVLRGTAPSTSAAAEIGPKVLPPRKA